MHTCSSPHTVEHAPQRGPRPDFCQAHHSQQLPWWCACASGPTVFHSLEAFDLQLPRLWLQTCFGAFCLGQQQADRCDCKYESWPSGGQHGLPRRVWKSTCKCHCPRHSMLTSPPGNMLFQTIITWQQFGGTLWFLVLRQCMLGTPRSLCTFSCQDVLLLQGASLCSGNSFHNWLDTWSLR